MSLWLLGGFDPTGGAGVLRDFATASVVAPQLSLRCVVTAWTRQGHGFPAESDPIEPVRLAQQLRGLERPAAVKIGLVPASSVDALLEMLVGIDAPVVVDPVLRASDGGDLGSTAAAYEPLLERATLITPNLHEAAALTGLDPEDGGVAALVERFPGVAILVKGGHSSDPDCVVDRLWSGGHGRELSRPRFSGPEPRGTGCALATAIACRLAEGAGVEQAVSDAVGWLDDVRTRAVSCGDAVHLPIR